VKDQNMTEKSDSFVQQVKEDIVREYFRLVGERDTDSLLNLFAEDAIVY